MKGYDIKVRLDDFRPLTWRDLIIPYDITFHQLHLIMQELWDFYDGHLYEFTTSSYTTKYVDFKRMDVDNNYIPDYGELDSRTHYISELFDSNNKIKYYYDFGDSWSFTIEIKKQVEYDKTYPTIKRFKGDYNPVEDCGGVFGLSMMIDSTKEYDDELNIFNLEDKQEELEINCSFINNDKKVIIPNMIV